MVFCKLLVGFFSICPAPQKNISIALYVTFSIVGISIFLSHCQTKAILTYYLRLRRLVRTIPELEIFLASREVGSTFTRPEDTQTYLGV